jgi:hypothetical protein
MLNYNFCFLPQVLSEVFANVTQTGGLKSSDRQILMTFLLQDELSEEYQRVINRILYGIRHHQIKIV